MRNDILVFTFFVIILILIFLLMNYIKIKNKTDCIFSNLNQLGMSVLKNNGFVSISTYNSKITYFNFTYFKDNKIHTTLNYCFKKSLEFSIRNLDKIQSCVSSNKDIVYLKFIFNVWDMKEKECFVFALNLNDDKSKQNQHFFAEVPLKIIPEEIEINCDWKEVDYYFE